MPFDIERGYGEGETKKTRPHPIVRESDMVYISPPADLVELLHLKVFHIPHKKKNNGKVQRRLIGEQYLRGNEVLGVVKKAKAKDVLNADSSELQTYGHVKLSNLLRKIRKLKVKKFSEQGYQKEVLDRLHQSSVEPRAISAGKPILQGLNDRTLDETIKWAFEYVEENIATISKTIFNVVDEVKNYAAWKEKNRLIKAGVTDVSLNSPRRKVAIVQTSDGGADATHLPFRRPKNIPLLDQLNRIDMMGFHKFIEAIAGGNNNNTNNTSNTGKPETPRQAIRQTAIWPSNPQSSTNPRPPIVRRLSTSQQLAPSNSPKKQSQKVGIAQILQSLEENSIAKPPSSVAGAYGSSTAPSSNHPSIKNHHPLSSSHNNHSLHNNTLSSPRKNRNISTAPSQISNLISQHVPSRPNNSPSKSDNRPKSSRINKYQENRTPGSPTSPRHTIVPSRPTSSHPTRSSQRKGNHRKSVLMSVNGLQQQILTDDDTTLLVKVDRRDSDHQIPPNLSDEEVEEEEEEEEEGVYVGDDDSDFGSIKYQKGNRTIAYSNQMELLTTEWNSQHLYRYNLEFDAHEIQDPKVQAYYRRGVQREAYLRAQQEITSSTTTRAEVTTERLVNVWEEFTNVYAREYRKINLLMDKKDFDRPHFIETLHECFFMDGNDIKLGQLGKNMMVDLMSMKRKAKHRIYCQKMEELSKSIWFITLLTKMREHSRKSYQRIPLSLFKFLAIIQVLLMYGWPLTVELFWQLIEKTIESQDHREIIVHRAIKAIRDHLSIGVEVFMNYLEKNEIQPCSELLSQIREIKQGRKRAERALQLKQKVVLGSYSPRDAKYNVKFMISNAILASGGNANVDVGAGTGAGDSNLSTSTEKRRTSLGKKLSIGSLPKSNLALIREQSEGIADYGIDNRKGSLLDPIHRLDLTGRGLNEENNESDDNDDDSDDEVGLSSSISEEGTIEGSIPEIEVPKKRR